jgi:hypothetical protein
MARQREIMVGSRDRFAVKIAFLTDPDQGRAATSAARGGRSSKSREWIFGGLRG